MGVRTNKVTTLAVATVTLDINQEKILWTEAPLSIGDKMSPGPGHLILAAPGLGWAGLGSCGRGCSLHTDTGTHHTFTQYYSIEQIIIIKYHKVLAVW